MSGGSLDYACHKIQYIAEDLQGSIHGGHLYRRLLFQHLLKLAEVLKSIEWSDSADYAPDKWILDTEEFLKEIGALKWTKSAD